jgi:hypothetical protein
MAVDLLWAASWASRFPFHGNTVDVTTVCSGYLIAAAGWPVFFATTMAMAAPALIVLWFVLG